MEELEELIFSPIINSPEINLTSPNVNTNQVAAQEKKPFNVDNYIDVNEINKLATTSSNDDLFLPTAYTVDQDRYKGMTIAPILLQGENNQFLEQEASKTQDYGDIFWNDSKVFGANIASTFAASFTGIYDMISQASFMPEDGSVTQSIANWRDDIQNDAINFKSTEQYQSPFLSYITTTQGRGEILSSLAYGIGAGLGFAAQNFIAGVATAGLANIPLVANAVKTSIQTGSKVLKYADKLADLAQVSKGAANIGMSANRAYKAYDYSKDLIRNYVSAIGEAEFEANESRETTKIELFREYVERYGVEPDEETLKKINQIAEKSHDTRYLLNAALLTFSNGAFLKPLFKNKTYYSQLAETAAKNGRTATLGTIGDDLNPIKLVNKSKLKGDFWTKNIVGKALNSTQGYSKQFLLDTIKGNNITWNEGFEEGYQYLVGKSTENYFSNLFMEDEKINDDLMSSITGLTQQMYKDRGMLLEEEGLQSVLTGILAGSGQNLFVKGKNAFDLKKMQKPGGETSYKLEYVGNRERKEFEKQEPTLEKSINEFVKSALSKPSLNPSTLERIGQFKNNVQYSNLQNTVNSTVASNTIATKSAFDTLSPYVELGFADFFLKDLDVSIKSMPLDQFNTWLGTDFKTVQEKDEHINFVKEDVKKIQEIHRKAEEASKNPFAINEEYDIFEGEKPINPYYIFETTKKTLKYHTFLADKMSDIYLKEKQNLPITFNNFNLENLLTDSEILNSEIQEQIDLVKLQVENQRELLKTPSETSKAIKKDLNDNLKILADLENSSKLLSKDKKTQQDFYDILDGLNPSLFEDTETKNELLSKIQEIGELKSVYKNHIAVVNSLTNLYNMFTNPNISKEEFAFLLNDHISKYIKEGVEATERLIKIGEDFETEVAKSQGKTDKEIEIERQNAEDKKNAGKPKPTPVVTEENDDISPENLKEYKEIDLTKEAVFAKDSSEPGITRDEFNKIIGGDKELLKVVGKRLKDEIRFPTKLHKLIIQEYNKLIDIEKVETKTPVEEEPLKPESKQKESIDASIQSKFGMSLFEISDKGELVATIRYDTKKKKEDLTPQDIAIIKRQEELRQENSKVVKEFLKNPTSFKFIKVSTPTNTKSPKFTEEGLYLDFSNPHYVFKKDGSAQAIFDIKHPSLLKVKTDEVISKLSQEVQKEIKNDNSLFNVVKVLNAIGTERDKEDFLNNFYSINALPGTYENFSRKVINYFTAVESFLKDIEGVDNTDIDTIIEKLEKNFEVKQLAIDFKELLEKKNLSDAINNTVELKNEAGESVEFNYLMYQQLEENVHSIQSWNEENGRFELVEDEYIRNQIIEQYKKLPEQRVIPFFVTQVKNYEGVNAQLFFSGITQIDRSKEILAEMYSLVTKLKEDLNLPENAGKKGDIAKEFTNRIKSDYYFFFDKALLEGKEKGAYDARLSKDGNSIEFTATFKDKDNQTLSSSIKIEEDKLSLPDDIKVFYDVNTIKEFSDFQIQNDFKRTSSLLLGKKQKEIIVPTVPQTMTEEEVKPTIDSDSMAVLDELNEGLSAADSITLGMVFTADGLGRFLNDHSLNSDATLKVILKKILSEKKKKIQEQNTLQGSENAVETFLNTYFENTSAPSQRNIDFIEPELESKVENLIKFCNDLS